MFEIFQYDFMIRAFIAGITTAIIAPLVGQFLVVRRLSLLADTLAHVSLVGVALGVLVGISPGITSTITAVLAAIGIERLRQSNKVFGESILALFLSGGLALAIVLISFGNVSNVNIFGFLFGSITTVTSGDIFRILGLGACVLFLTLLLYKELFFISFNEELADANGLPVRWLNMVLVILSAVTVALAMRIVGVLLIGALMVIPVVSAMQFGLSFKRTLLVSLLLSTTSVILGLYASYYLDIASGGSVVLVALMLFVVSLLYVNLKKWWFW